MIGSTREDEFTVEGQLLTDEVAALEDGGERTLGVGTHERRVVKRP